ncbi:hypothetical protein DR980_08780 [Flavobacterium psychrolimnae]|uniref:Uncharacterized protein n=1 Tax=Flavobacterium psychrolimnae TaxID=249351 RepID=A0A366AZB3_9FLAO|nr:hypothetical protein DR980_08780 [Flavobacterium psychrolimnae]
MKFFLNTCVRLAGIENFAVFEQVFQSGCKLLKNIDKTLFSVFSIRIIFSLETKNLVGYFF